MLSITSFLFANPAEISSFAVLILSSLRSHRDLVSWCWCVVWLAECLAGFAEASVHLPDCAVQELGIMTSESKNCAYQRQCGLWRLVFKLV
jgi:hypothetical protein